MYTLVVLYNRDISIDWEMRVVIKGTLKCKEGYFHWS